MTTYMKIVEERISGLAKGVDETVDSWFLMSSPAPVVGVVLVYLAFVLKIGPEYMKNRKPMDLKRIMVFYNAFQVLYSIWMCRTSIQESNVMASIFSKKCEINRTREQNLTLYSGAWFYFFSKIIDLLDTTFFVLRKKDNQISFLHVYHHTITVLFSWGYLKYAPGEQGVIIGILNSGVHIIMYFYYMVAAMGPQYQKYLWWKKYMTSIQLIQFVLILGYMLTVGAKGCNMPKTLTFFFVGNTIIFLYLFGNFYRKTYKKAKSLDGGSTRTTGSSLAQSALRAAGGMGCMPQTMNAGKHSLQNAQPGKVYLDLNNNSVKPLKLE
ncbi:elongation of very long chain fatty acids protein 7 [Drosophila eugracilis]|uniref:elongation of very long chain fatty acids protein 7 n=1 Tax=Drosophila eugracilis TaxID=29029 RepID=UPI0007E63481|nr:elongation of very long chain fatty acids protein 7 [Drosophila eugracilis]XP_041675113.1 elongation of very long chain fatty acids protein 7 [Drosophila eugracilis]